MRIPFWLVLFALTANAQTAPQSPPPQPGQNVPCPAKPSNPTPQIHPHLPPWLKARIDKAEQQAKKASGIDPGEIIKDANRPAPHAPPCRQNSTQQAQKPAQQQ